MRVYKKRKDSDDLDEDDDERTNDSNDDHASHNDDQNQNTSIENARNIKTKSDGFAPCSQGDGSKDKDHDTGSRQDAFSGNSNSNNHSKKSNTHTNDFSRLPSFQIPPTQSLSQVAWLPCLPLRSGLEEQQEQDFRDANLIRPAFYLQGFSRQGFGQSGHRYFRI